MTIGCNHERNSHVHLHVTRHIHIYLNAVLKYLSNLTVSRPEGDNDVMRLLNVVFTLSAEAPPFDKKN